MSEMRTKRKPRFQHPLREGVSYGDAAKAVGRSRNHVFLVCRGDRESRALLDRLRAEDLLAPLEKGIGHN